MLAKSLEAQVLQSDNSALAKDCRKEVKAINGRLLKLGRRDYAERRALRSELKLLLKEERKRQERAVADVISGSQVHLTSPSTANLGWSHIRICALSCLARSHGIQMCLFQQQASAEQFGASD